MRKVIVKFMGFGGQRNIFTMVAICMLMLLTACTDTPEEMLVFDPRVDGATSNASPPDIFDTAVNSSISYPTYNTVVGNPEEGMPYCIWTVQALGATLGTEQIIMMDYEVYEISDATGCVRQQVGPTIQVGVVTWLIGQLQNNLIGGVEAVYKNLTRWSDEEIDDLCISPDEKDRYRAAGSGWPKVVGAMMMLAIIVMGISAVFGLKSVTPFGLIVLVAKMVIVWLLVGTPEGWGIFSSYLRDGFETFISAMSTELSVMFSGPESVMGDPLTLKDGGITLVDKQYNAADRLLSMLFRADFIKLLMALTVSGWQGWAYALMLVATMVAYIKAMIFVVRAYLIAMVGRALLYALAPLFIPMILFKETKSLFDNWIAMMANFTLLPIMLFAFIGMFHELMLAFLKIIVKVDDSKICYDKIDNPIKGMIDNDLYLWQFQTHADYTNLDQPIMGGIFTDVPLNMMHIFVALVLVSVLAQMVKWTEQAAANMSQSFTTAMADATSTWSTYLGRK